MRQEGGGQSLDQLLGQGLSEREEVTYELNERGCVRIHVLERTEAGVGSVQLERQVMRGAALLGLTTSLCWGGFSALLGLQSSLSSDYGQLSLGVVHCTAFVSATLGPLCVHRFGVKATLMLSCMAHALYVGTSTTLNNAYVLFLSSVVVGCIMGPEMTALTSHLAKSVSRLTFVTQATKAELHRRFLRSFFVSARSSLLWGPAVATFALDVTPDADVVARRLGNETVVRRDLTDVCAAPSCGERFFGFDRHPYLDYHLSPHESLILSVAFCSCVLLSALLVLVFVERLQIQEAQDPGERGVVVASVRRTTLMLRDRSVRLAAPLAVFVGVTRAFIFGDFTARYAVCSLGVSSTCATLSCLGGSSLLGVAAVHLFQQHFRRIVLLAAGLVLQAGLLAVVRLWRPQADDAAVFYVVAGGWGLCDAVWETLATTFLSTNYPDDWQALLCFYYQAQWLGMGVTFILNRMLCAEIKIMALAVALTVAIIPYMILEFRLHQRRLMRNSMPMI